jgi:hypothetical protein
MKLHHLLQKYSFFLIKLAAVQASGAAYVKLRLAGTANRLNVERPTSNVEYGWRCALSNLKQANRRIPQRRTSLEGWFCFAQLFFN